MPVPLNPNLWPVVLHDEDGVPVSPVNPIPLALTQVQNVETSAPLGAGASAVGSSRDCINYESFGISAYVAPSAGQVLDVTVLVENSTDGVTFRTVDTINLSGAADAAAQLNRVYSVCREFYRVTVTNNDGAHALSATELISMLKPI